MKHSLSFRVTMMVLKLKGIKNNFSKDPIDYKKIRKEDVHQPKGGFFNQEGFSQFKVAQSNITEVKNQDVSSGLLIFIHGGAFISGPAKHHWDTIKTLAEQTGKTVWMCDYPKAPENDIGIISENIDEVYQVAMQRYPDQDISLIGDSAGATLIAALTQRLIIRKSRVPDTVVLVSPVMDSSMSNPEIEKVDPIDPMLSKTGVFSAKKMCAGDFGVTNEMISPLNGSFKGFPKTMMVMAENDITYPDQLLTIDKLKNENVDLEIIVGKGMPHIWPFLPVMQEGKTALKKIINFLNN